MKKFVALLLSLVLMAGVAVADPFALPDATLVSDERGSIYVIREENGVLASIDPELNDLLKIAIVVGEEITDQMMEETAEEVFSKACWEIDAEFISDSFTVLGTSVEQENGATLVWKIAATVKRKTPMMGSMDVMKDVVPEKETEEVIILRVYMDDSLTMSTAKEFVSIASTVEEAEAILQKVVE